MTCQELDLRLAYEKGMAEVSQTGGGKTFIAFLRMYKEIHKEKEEVAIHLRDAEHTEVMAGTHILMCDSDPDMTLDLTLLLQRCRGKPVKRGKGH